MNVESSASFPCPCCAEDNVIPVDISAGSRQEFVVDCQVCCAPIAVTVRIRGESVELEARRENA